MSFLMQRRSSSDIDSVSSPSMNYFKDVLAKVGVSLQYSESSNIYLKEQALIIRDIEKELHQHPNHPRNIQEFISGLKLLIKKQNWFKKALQPSQLQQITDGDVITGVQQENLFRLLLSVDCLQTEIISIVVEEITSHAVTDTEDTIWLRLLLGPLRYLSYIQDSKILTKNLLEIIEVATYPSQLEILNYLPDIIPDCEYEDAAIQLSNILKENSELTSAIIECLNYLNLCPDTKADIQDQILAILNCASSLKTFPAIFCFLVTDCKPGNLPAILLKTRNALESIMIIQNVSNDNDSAQLMTFDEIRVLSCNSKPVSDGWISLISNIRSAQDHKCVDIIILIMLHTSGHNRKNQIEGIFKKKIKTKQLKSSLVELTLQKYLVPQIMKDYIKSILEIATCLLRMHSDVFCLEFARIFYITLFTHRYAEKQHRQQILNSLIVQTASCDNKGTIPAFNIMQTIADQNLELLQPHSMQIMTLLDKLEDTNLGEVKQMFDLLCGLTCGPRADESMNVYQNDIHMIVRKMLSCSKKIIKYRGVIAAVATAKNIATVLNLDETTGPGDESCDSISDLPVGAGKQAASLLELANTSTASNPIAQALYYDQLAQMVVTSDALDKHFMAWLFDIITNNFRDVYVTETVPGILKDIPVYIQFNLNSNDEIVAPIAINIAELTITSTTINSMLVFAPLFRLLRLIHHRQYDANLSTIDALLGCGIILPELDPDVGIDSFDSEQSKLVVDCLFHCINWFREIISAFVTQKSKKLRQKVLERLKQLVDMEELFIKCMNSIPDHKLPMSYFYNAILDTSNISIDRKPDKLKRKRPGNPNNTTKVTQSTQASTSKPGRKTQIKDPEFKFREVDTDLIHLLEYPLISNGQDPSVVLTLTLPQFKFIMKDLVTKLNSLTNPNTTSTFTHLVTVMPEQLITDCIRLMPHLNRHLISVIEEIKHLLQRSDGIHDTHEMFLQEATELKVTLALIFEALSLILGWSGFQDSKHLPLLREGLRALVDEESSQLNSAQILISQFLKFVVALSEYCLTLQSAVHLVNIAKALCSVSIEPGPKRKLFLLSGKLLTVKWFALSGLPETGAAANINIDTLVQTHLNGSNIETLSSVVSWMLTECAELKSKDDNLSTFPSINKSNFPILYRAVCSTLVQALNGALIGLTNNQHLDIWQNIAATLRSLMDIVKVQGSRTNLISFFKKSKDVLKVFLAQGLPVLEIMLRSESDRVTDILRTLQLTTRFIHKLCCHSKVTKDSALIAHVPQMRLTLETLVYRVKAALIANKCSAAFWMGTLRNKNLQGEEIFSQSCSSSSMEQNGEQDGGEDEEELPEDEDSEADTVVLTTVSDNDSSEII